MSFSDSNAMKPQQTFKPSSTATNPFLIAPDAWGSSTSGSVFIPVALLSLDASPLNAPSMIFSLVSPQTQAREPLTTVPSTSTVPSGLPHGCQIFPYTSVIPGDPESQPLPFFSFTHLLYCTPLPISHLYVAYCAYCKLRTFSICLPAAVSRMSRYTASWIWSSRPFNS